MSELLGLLVAAAFVTMGILSLPSFIVGRVYRRMGVPDWRIKAYSACEIATGLILILMILYMTLLNVKPALG